MPASNRVNALTTTVNVAENFGSAVDGWTWRASNAGPSSSQVTDSGVGTGKCLQLSGGSLGHYEELQFLGYLDPHGSYSLTYKVKADAGFAAQLGDAGWYLQFFTAAGETVRLSVSSTAAATTQWQTVGPLSLDCASFAAMLGLNSHVIKVGLLLVNAKYQLDHMAAAALYVTDIGLSGTSTAQPYGYDANGNVTAAPARNLVSLSYEAVSGLTSVVTLTGVEAQRVNYAYDSSGLRSAAVTDYGNGVTDKTLYLRDPFGNLLMRRTTSGVTEAVTSFLPDLSGSLATHTDGGERYLLKDHLGSSCFTVSATGAAEASLQYGPFGELLAGPSGDEMPYRYTGQEQDDALGIYNYNARLYDPALRRFYECDPAVQDPSLYVYVGNSPINLTDPSGQAAYRITSRSFISAATAGFVFKGDARGFTTDPNATARVHHSFVVETEKMEVYYEPGYTFSSPSRIPFLNWNRTETPVGNVTPSIVDGTIHIESSYSGSDPFFFGFAPPLDVSASFYVTQTGSILSIAARVMGDAFPETELFITDPAGTSVLLGASESIGAENSLLPLTLIGGADVQIMNINLEIVLRDGNFNSIMFEQAPYSLSKWQEFVINHARMRPEPFTWIYWVGPAALGSLLSALYLYMRWRSPRYQTRLKIN